MEITIITKQTMYRNLKGHKVRTGEWSVMNKEPIGLPIEGVFTGGIKGRQGGYQVDENEYSGHIFYTRHTTKYGRSKDKTFYLVYKKDTNTAYWINVLD